MRLEGIFWGDGDSLHLDGAVAQGHVYLSKLIGKVYLIYITCKVQLKDDYKDTIKKTTERKNIYSQ